MLRRQKKTILLLGSGASAASTFKLPTMAGFFAKGLTSEPELKSFLNAFYPGKSPQSYNLEEVLSYLDLAKARLQFWGYGQKADEGMRLYDLLLKYVKKRLAIPQGALCDLHKELFKRMEPKDTIITLNYDLVADNTLLNVEPKNAQGGLHQDSRMGKISGLLGRSDLWTDPPPSLMPREQERGFYLKLHGSLNWLNCPNMSCSNNINLFSLSVSSLKEGQSEGMPCRQCGAALQTYIIPPVATKRLEDRGRMAFLWHLALKEIASATHIVVLGLSFAPSDFELRWLIKQGILLNDGKGFELHVANKSVCDIKEVCKVFPLEAKRMYKYKSIKDYLKGKGIKNN